MKAILSQCIERKETNSVKWDGIEPRFNVSDALPMWIADMDAKTAPAIAEALSHTAAQGHFGYTLFSPKAQQAIADWYARRHKYIFKAEDTLFSNGVVPGLTYAMLALTSPGDGVVIQTPVYPPFHDIVERNQRTLLKATLKQNGETYEMDFDSLEEQFKHAKMMFLCSPHNPIGRVWTRSELERVVELAHRHDVIIVSDEIHADLTYPSYEHISVGTLSDRVITVSAPSKAFNIAGLTASYLICPNGEWRQKIYDVQQANHVAPSPFANSALVAAYTHPEAERWLDQLCSELEAHTEYVTTEFHHRLPEVVVNKPQASFLLWLNFRNIPMNEDERREWLLHKAKVVLSPGKPFCETASSFERLNYGTSRRRIDAAITHLRAALDELTVSK